jgi:DNA primase
MTARDARELRRAPLLMDPAALCSALGLLEGAQRQGGGLLVKCPAHADRTPSCSVRRGADGTVACRCHGCEWTGDALGLVAVVGGLDVRRDFPAVVARAAELAGIAYGAAWTRPPRPTVSAPPPREYPPAGEVRALWSACRPALDDAEVSAWLRSRGLDAGDVEARDLARALPPSGALTWWARYQGRPWPEAGYRCILPLFDRTGAMRSVRARQITGGEGPKALPPAGHAAGRLLLADALGRMLLETGARPAWWPAGVPLRVVIAEGEPDFLTWATRSSDAEASAFAVLGLPGSGAWSAALAGRVPDGARVVVRTDADEAGDRYAHAVAASLVPRCEVLRTTGGAS